SAREPARWTRASQVPAATASETSLCRTAATLAARRGGGGGGDGGGGRDRIDPLRGSRRAVGARVEGRPRDRPDRARHAARGRGREGALARVVREDGGRLPRRGRVRDVDRAVDVHRRDRSPSLAARRPGASHRGPARAGGDDGGGPAPRR